MTKIYLVLTLVFLIIQTDAQQSTSGKYRPENVSIGLINNTNKNQILINNVPSYIWHRGCGPTALGMLIGYYDVIGYSDLIPGDASTQTENVNNAIANQQHYNDYSLPKDYYPDLFDDKSTTGGAHTSNCIADFMKTSWSSSYNRWGWSWSNQIDNAFEDYIEMQNANIETITSYNNYNSSSWDAYKNEINNNRPVILLVDTDGDGYTDHFITAIGYDESTLQYAAYDTWDSNIHWFYWQGLANENEWGIYGFNILKIISPISINSVYKNSISIYPIPTKNNFNIEIKNKESIYNNIKVSLFNYQGKKLLEKYFSKDASNIKLNVSNINSGVYFLKVNIGKSDVITKKVIISK